MTRAEAVTHFRGEQKHYSAFMQPSLAEACKIAADALEAVERLKAEIQVRDNMGDEVLRLLREATGKRDFHSEMEAAEWAAKMLADARKDSARKQFLCQQGCYMAHDKDGESCWLIWPHGKDGDGEPEAQSGMYDSHNAAIDAAIKEAK